MTTAPRTWVVGEVVTAAMLNAEIRDQFNSFFTWTTWVPVWTASTTNPSLGSGVNAGTLGGLKLVFGTTCQFIWQLNIGSAVNPGSGTYKMTLPATAATPTGGLTPGVADYTYTRSSNPNFIVGRGPIPGGSTDSNSIWFASTTVAGDWDTWANNVPWTPAAGDVARGYGSYKTV